jgi:outer membrane lipoprotein-sorting protein
MLARRAHVFVFLVAVLAVRSAGAASLSAREVLDRVDDLFRSRSGHGRARMTVVTEHWTRSLELEFWSQGEERSLVRILAPQKEKDTATLKVGRDVWNYLPKVKRVIKLPSSMMSASWMGSHFTNDDLVKENRFADEYTYTVSFEGVRDGVPVIEITCVPKEDAPVVWGRVVVLVRTDDWLPLAIDYFDEGGRPARTMTYGDVRMLGGRRIPSRLTVVPADKPNESTTVVYEEIEFDVPLEPDTFSLQNLQR